MARATEYDVFISFKNLDDRGLSTPDSALAAKVHQYLASRGLRVFFSSVTLETLGVSAYKKAIDDALDESRILVAVGTSSAHLDWKWVRYEWDSFYSDILSEVKPHGRVFVYVDGLDARSLPRALRQSQCFHDSPESLQKLYNFVANALRQDSQPEGSSATRGAIEKIESQRSTANRAAYLAYASADEGYAWQLLDRLDALGIVSVRPERAPGSHWAAQIAEAIKQAAVFVVLLSRNSTESRFLRHEVEFAAGLRKSLLPVVVDDASLGDVLEFHLASFQRLDGRARDVREVAADVANAIDRLTSR